MGEFDFHTLYQWFLDLRSAKICLVSPLCPPPRLWSNCLGVLSRLFSFKNLQMVLMYRQIWSPAAFCVVMAENRNIKHKFEHHRCIWYKSISLLTLCWMSLVSSHFFFSWIHIIKIIKKFWPTNFLLSSRINNRWALITSDIFPDFLILAF